MLIATHEMGFAREVADEVCFLHEGAIVERGSADHMFAAPEHPETQKFLRRLLDAGRLCSARRPTSRADLSAWPDGPPCARMRMRCGDRAGIGRMFARRSSRCS